MHTGRKVILNQYHVTVRHGWFPFETYDHYFVHAATPEGACMKVHKWSGAWLTDMTVHEICWL